MIYDRNNLPDDIKNLPDADFEPLHQEDIKDEKFKTKPVGFFKDAMIRLSKNRVPEYLRRLRSGAAAG